MIITPCHITRSIFSIFGKKNTQYASDSFKHLKHQLCPEGEILTKEDILKCLNASKNQENNRKLLAFCSVPRTFDEMKKAGIKGNLFDSLADLKRADALSFADGKYFASPMAIEIQKTLQ